MKRGMKYKDFKQGLDMGEADELQCEACWTGYKQVGLKKKGDRMVPNCVHESKELLDMQEADLTKRQVKMVHKAADKLDKKDFMKRYGKDGDSVRYATATNMVKKKLGIEEQRKLSSPEVAATLRQIIAQRPFIDNKKDYEELMRLAAKDMGMFNARLNRMNDQTKEKVKSALQRKGLTSHLTNEKEPKGDKPMQEQSYKDKFNATMKDLGIKSLGDLKSDEEKKKFFKAVDAKHDAKNEVKEAMNTAMDGGMSMPDMNLKAMKKMNAMKMSEPMKKMDDKETENPKKDADMSKVKDKQVMLKAMMKKEAEVPAEPMGKLKTGEKMKNEEAEPLTRPTMSLKDKMKIKAMKKRHEVNQNAVKCWIDIAPAMGMVGTLIGLVLMLGNMSAPKAIGPAMAVALLTTMYGAIIANVLYLPLLNKLEGYTEYELVYREMVVTGLRNIARSESPRNIQDQMVANLAPKMQEKLEMHFYHDHSNLKFL